MSVAIYISQANEAHSLVSWGIRFARADHTDLVVVVPRRQKQAEAKFDPLMLNEREDSELFKAVFESIESHPRDQVVLKELVAEGIASSDHDRVLIETIELVSQQPEDDFVEKIGDMDITKLILPVANITMNRAQGSWSQRLYETAPCETMMVRGEPPTKGLNVLVVAQQESNADAALKRACRLTKSEEGESSVTLLFVRPNDDEVAESVARSHIENILAKVSDRKNVEVEIALSNSLASVFSEMDMAKYDVAIMGTRHLKAMRKFFRLKLDDPAAAKAEGDEETEAPSKSIAVATLRPAVPLGNRFKRNLQVLVRRVVPQLDKENRVNLVDRLQSGSVFNFDFISLISLSTIIAALGLLDNSAAVVIGAMLVAPLMTPLVGMGFALIQANERLMKTSIRSVLYGFAVAFLIGAMLGVLVNLFTSHGISPEMGSRDAPSLVDFFVALFSGVAGAYAMSRPNLISALPGVAIAAALVPPIATSGMAFTMGDFTLGGGALLLFFTNIVAIVLGTTVTFWAVGINTRMVKPSDGGTERAPQMWPRYWFIGFVIVSFFLAVEMQIYNPVYKTPKLPESETVEPDETSNNAPAPAVVAQPDETIETP